MSNTREWIPYNEGLLYRPRIQRLFEEMADKTLIAVVAGPGYGKTQAVAQYVRKSKSRVIWYTCSLMDDDPNNLWESVAAAVKPELPELVDAFSDMQYPDSQSMKEHFLRLLAKSVYAGTSVVLVVDDLDVPNERYIKDLLKVLLDAKLENFTAILVSNDKRDIRYLQSAYKMENRTIGMEDLAFNEHEANELLRQAGNKASKTQLHQLLEQNEGWPFAMNIFAYKGTHTQSVDGWKISADLFEHEYFLKYDGSVQMLLVKLSFFGMFSLEMVNRIGGMARHEAPSFFDYHIFVRYHPENKYYSFHSAYKEWLTHKQPQVERDEVRRIFEITGEFLIEENMLAEAIFCFNKSGSTAQLLNALERIPCQRVSKEAAPYNLEAIDGLSEEIRRENPIVDLAKASILLDTLEVEKAEQILLSLKERYSDAVPGSDESLFLGEVYAKLIDVSLLLNRSDFTSIIRKASSLLPNGSRYINDKMRYVGSNSTFFLPDNKPGTFDKMVDSFFEIAPVIESVMNGCGHGYELLFATEAFYYKLRFDTAKEYAFRAINKAQERAQHDVVCNAYYILIRTAVLQGEYLTAKKYRETLTTYIENHNLSYMMELKDNLDAGYFLRLGDIGKVPRWIQCFCQAENPPPMINEKSPT